MDFASSQPWHGSQELWFPVFPILLPNGGIGDSRHFFVMTIIALWEMRSLLGGWSS